MKALIIGGSGGLSGTLAKDLLKENEVYAVTRGIRKVPDGVKQIIVDRNDTKAFKEAVSFSKWDVVFDCICMNADHARQDIEVLSSLTKRLIVISTDSVYHHAYKKTPQNEDGIYVDCNVSGYAENKRLMEVVFEEYFKGEGDMKVTIFRPGHIYGPPFTLGCFPNHSRQADLIEYMKEKKPLNLVGMGTYIIQPIFVSDLAKTMIDCVENEKTYNEIFCIGGPEAVENRIYYEIIGEILGTKVTIKEVALEGFLEAHPEYSGHLCHRIYDLTKLRNTGVPLPSTSLKEGMRQTIDALTQ